MIIGKKENGKAKVNWEAIGVIITVLVLFAAIIGSHTLSQAQTEATAKTVDEIVINTTQKVEGSLKSDVENNKDVNAKQCERISVLEAGQKEMRQIQKETRRAISDMNKKMDSNQRDIMNALLKLGGDG